MKRLVALAVIAHAGPARADDSAGIHWHIYAALRNDVFTEVIPPIDDRGFTHDNVVQTIRLDEDRRLGFGGRFVHRWITSRADRRRWDQVELTALAVRTGTVPFLPIFLDGTATLGPTFGGNFGGRYLQNGWHAITGTGPTVDEGLANDYPAGRQIGIVAGARGRVRVGQQVAYGYGVLDTQLGLGGGGVSIIDAALGGVLGTRHVGAHAEVALTNYWVSDELLALPGGYDEGFHVEWRVGVHVAWSRFRLSYQYRANEGGSGEPIGVIAFESRR